MASWSSRPTAPGSCCASHTTRACGCAMSAVSSERRSSSPREQPAHEFPIVDLQVQRHIRGHPQFAAYQVSRAGLVHVPWDSVEDKPACGRRPAPAAPCRAQPGRARVRPGRDTSGRPGRGGPPRHVIAQQFTGRDMGDVEVHGSSFPAPRRRCTSAATATCSPAAPHSVIRGQRPPRRPTRQQQLTRQPEPASTLWSPRDAWLRRPSDLCRSEAAGGC